MSLIELLRRYPLPKTLAFPEHEYADRLAAVRAAMSTHEIDVLLVGNAANQSWLTGYESVMPSAPTLVIVPRTGELEIVCPDLDASCVELYSTVTTVHVESWHTGRDMTTIVTERLAAHATAGARIGVELGKIDAYSAPGIDAATYAVLKEALSDRAWADATLLIAELRLIKSDAEITCMRQAGVFTEIGLRAAIDAIAVGRTDNEVSAAFSYAAISAGSDVLSIDPQIVTGERCGYMPFLTHKRVALRTGDSVYLECTGVSNRYNAPLMRSAVLGTPDDTTTRLANIAIDTVDALLDAITPGRTGDDITKQVAPIMAALPEDSYFAGTYGYSTGLGLQPTWSEYPAYIADGMELELAPNMTFHLPIAIWSVRERTGVGFSETIRVTDSGCELITPGTFRELVVR